MTDWIFLPAWHMLPDFGAYVVQKLENLSGQRKILGVKLLQSRINNLPTQWLFLCSEKNYLLVQVFF